MKRLIKFGSVSLVICGAIAIAGEAFANIPAISQYNTTNQTTGVVTRFVRIVNTPRVQVPVTIAGQPQTATRQVRLNACGQAILSASGITLISFNSGVVESGNVGVPDLLAAAAEPTPTCDTATGASSLNNDPNAGLMIRPVINIGGGRVLINAGKLPSNQPRVIDVAVTQNQTRQRFVSTNACGIATINLGETSSIPNGATIAVGNGAAVAINTLPSGGSVPMTDCAGSAVAVNTGFPSGTNFKNAAGDLFIASPSSQNIQVTLPTGATVNRSVTSDRCGGITIGSATNPQTSAFTLNGVSINPDTLATGLKPNCREVSGSYSYDVGATGSVKLSDGRIFVATTASNPTGFGDRRIYTISTTAAASPRNYGRDACNVVRIRQTTPPFDSIDTSLGSFTVSELPTREYLCRNVGGSSIGYASPAP